MSLFRKSIQRLPYKFISTPSICSFCVRTQHTIPAVLAYTPRASNKSRAFSTSETMAAKYPTREEIEAIFKHMETGDYAETFKHIDANVYWSVMGTHPLAGTYKTLADFQKSTLQRLAVIMKEPGIRLKVRNVIGGGDQPWAVVELIADAECKNGLDFDNTYAWCMKFNEEGKVVHVRAYLDTALVKQAIVENECPSHRAPTEDA